MYAKWPVKKFQRARVSVSLLAVGFVVDNVWVLLLICLLIMLFIDLFRVCLFAYFGLVLF